MGFKRFSILIIARTSLIMGNLILMSLLYTEPGYHAATLLCLIVLIMQSMELVRFVSRTNAELTRFLDAARYADFSQRFELTSLGSGFGELGAAFTDILERFRVSRAATEEELRHLKAVIEHVPVPLMSIGNSQEVTLWNNAARRLFGSNSVTRLDDLNRFGEEFGKQLSTFVAGEKKLIDFEIDGMELQLSIAATQLMLPGRQEVLLSLQDIQSELDSAQLQAWQELVRVLTHEIMNSITPVASLANTAVDLIEDAKQKVNHLPEIVEELNDANNAVSTVARRSEGLTKFVGSYRRLNKLPTPVKKRFPIQSLFEQVASLSAQQRKDKTLVLETTILPKDLDLTADSDLLEQVLLNLLQNAEHAVELVQQPKIQLHAFLNKRGRVVIEVSDNGTGIPEELVKKIFVPFYTTKRQGSGVGLALTRQVMLAHQGKVKVESADSVGCTFSLIF